MGDANRQAPILGAVGDGAPATQDIGKAMNAA